jgi:tetratricopeptide (TPR) repeat protein
MPPTTICIVARLMSRLALALCAALAFTGCDDLDGRASNRKANRLFGDGRFIDAATLYEGALKKVPDVKIEYNLGLAYSRIFRGTDDLILIGEQGDGPCTTIPGVAPLKRSVCVKNDPDEEDRSYAECSDKVVCPSSATCKPDLALCSITSKQLANMAADHIKKWIAVQPPDDELRKKDEELTKELTELETKRDTAATEAEKHRDQATGKFIDKGAYEEAMNKKVAADAQIKEQKEAIEENRLKFTMRTLITNLWVDSNQFDNALGFWSDELKARPTDFEAMGKLAGINLKATNYRKAIEWYLIIADKVPEESNKISAFSSVGNVAWSKLNQKNLDHKEAMELSAIGIAAFQKAHELAPKNLSFLRIQASLYTFRAQQQGGMWANTIERASSEDLKGLSAVISGQAKQAPAPVETPPKKEAPPKTTPPDKKAGG